MPYGFYNILRCVTSGAAIFILLTGRMRLQDFQVFELIVVALVFNPIHELHLGREIWQIMDLIAAAIFFWTFKVLNKKPT
jgi:hypothetical protein